MVPEIGPKVVGATYCPEDGHTNPLYLLRALHQAFTGRGGKLVNGGHVERVEFRDPGFRLTAGNDTWEADQVVLCAGLGNAELAPMLDLHAPVRPNRGQVLITERLRRVFEYPSVQIRQVGEGAVQIGDSKEDVGFDDGTHPRVISNIARRAVQTYPMLESVRMVRSWGALRVMSPDGHPIYDRSRSCPGAFLVTCHSGVTLAAVHTLVLAGWIAGETAPTYLESFSADRPALRAAA
jgi:glycine/D-amino acid oxidase-like deaminating enzyme